MTRTQVKGVGSDEEVDSCEKISRHQKADKRKDLCVCVCVCIYACVYAYVAAVDFFRMF